MNIDDLLGSLTKHSAEFAGALERLNDTLSDSVSLMEASEETASLIVSSPI